MVSPPKLVFPPVLSFFLILASFFPTSSGFAQPVQKSGFNAGWYDDFDDSNELDTAQWNAIYSDRPTNNSLQVYLEDQVSVADGNLVITSENRPYLGFQYRSGQVQSAVSQQYGRWEVRAKLPTSRGMWPAIWLVPDTPNWPSQGEIDIMENRGDEPHTVSSAFHWGTNPPFNHSYTLREHSAFVGGRQVNYHDSFHTYAVEWTPKQVRFFIDDVHHFTVRDQEVGGFLSRQTDGMRLTINTAIGGNFLSPPDSSTVWPQEFLIDYVHTYTLADQSGIILDFDNGDFDQSGGSLAHWSTFGNTVQNVTSTTLISDTGEGALKLFGQFSGAANFSGVEQGMTVEAGQTISATARSLVDATDSIRGTDNRVSLKIDYYREAWGAFGTSDLIRSDEIIIADGSTLEDFWEEFELISVVPEGAVEARLAIVFSQFDFDGGAVFVDSVRFHVVPEPSSTAILCLALTACLSRRRRR